MERLTEYRDKVVAPVPELYFMATKENIPEENWNNYVIKKMSEKLAKYEDLEERCIKENSWCLRMLLHKRKEFIDDIHELYEYRKLEEQGRLLKLPAAEMSTVYEIIYDTSGCPHCFGICGCYGCEKSNPKSIQKAKFWASMRGRFNKDIFLTYEEAEAALKEMENKE